MNAIPYEQGAVKHFASVEGAKGEGSPGRKRTLPEPEALRFAPNPEKWGGA